MAEQTRVLIVDDCADTRTVFTHLLQLLGAEVITADDGRMSIECVVSAIQEGKPFQLILMDIRMPEVNGPEAAKLIREQGYTGLIAACTASSSGVGRRESQDVGIDVYFDKRMVNKELMSVLLQQCSTKR